ncbi:M55 family metallopeptidase [Neomoorella thermoacetica]|uniref:D-aminopeptidase DppA, Metallo peptidase, MEROPS family M55 n=1 Tax=Moorella thermoacetica (strain ATCC 39073 / JCM 9320) TaxID=264732 RepID=Q2RJ10_MOOTA|nr:M55 family metallopeptidase [Moorella thermoacetica]AKX94040.1 D-aminopeptidase [Moorella thermoacetica]AKX96679.1 D-aminopeptidase [Moorella thermoacetica]APC08432.1 D-aminopeptidase [Moorella thermoacetica]OIQ56408.1 D-aminopeptidase [Moorella thermoacetica]OIQ57849.1 D-aminopeptidase [Moorella thermoacetica]
MRVYISADMEGVAGICAWEQVEARAGTEYARCQKLMTAEVNAAVHGALQAGATTVCVNDAHDGMRNILVENLHPGAQLISGTPKRLGMMEGIDRGFTAACFLGYHARAGSPGVLAHTYSEVVHRLEVNGEEMGELGLNALLAGYFGVPVVLVSGDQVLAGEARKLLGNNIEIVIVKEALNYHAVRSLSHRQARTKILQGMLKALARKNLKHLPAPAPARVTIEFNDPARAAAAAILPRCQRLNAVTVTYTGGDYLEAYQAVRSLIGLAKSV